MSDDMSSPPRRKLTPKQELFIIEYAKDFNATQAAMRAGYSAKTANEQGAQLLAKLSVLIQERKDQRLVAAGGVVASTGKVDAIATLEQSLRMVTALAFYDHRKLYEGDSLKSQSQLTRREALMVTGFDLEENFVGVGEKAVHVGYTKKVKLVDRAPYLNMLLKWHRAFPGSKDAPPPPPGPAFNAANWDEADWEAFKRLYQKSQQSNQVIDGQPSGT